MVDISKKRMHDLTLQMSLREFANVRFLNALEAKLPGHVREAFKPGTTRRIADAIHDAAGTQLETWTVGEFIQSDKWSNLLRPDRIPNYGAVTRKAFFALLNELGVGENGERVEKTLSPIARELLDELDAYSSSINSK